MICSFVDKLGLDLPVGAKSFHDIIHFVGDRP